MSLVDAVSWLAGWQRDTSRKAYAAGYRRAWSDLARDKTLPPPRTAELYKRADKELGLDKQLWVGEKSEAACPSCKQPYGTNADCDECEEFRAQAEPMLES